MKNRDEIARAVEAAMAERWRARRMEPIPVGPDTPLTEAATGLDSLDLVEIWLELEDQLNLKFPEEDIREAKTVGELLSLIETVQQAQMSTP